MSDKDERYLTRRMHVNSWTLFIAYSMAGFLFLSVDVAIGVLVGGVLVTVNMHLLNRAVNRILTPGKTVTLKSLLSKYYLRFAATVVIIFILIKFHLVDELGLLLGLSMFIVNVFIVAFTEMGKILLKKVNEEAV